MSAVHERIRELVVSLFNDSEIRILVAALGDDRVTTALPGSTASPALVSHELVGALVRTGNLAAFVALMREARPLHRVDIDAAVAGAARPAVVAFLRVHPWRSVIVVGGLLVALKLVTAGNNICVGDVALGDGSSVQIGVQK